MRLIKALLLLILLVGMVFFINKKPSKQLKVSIPKRMVQKMPKLSPRQAKLRELLENIEEADMSVLRDKFPKVTERTIRRDLNTLINNKLIQKTGSTKAASYSII